MSDDNKIETIMPNNEMIITKHLTPDECPICQAKSVGAKDTRDFHTRPEIHARDLAVKYGISDEQVMDHINNHELIISITENTDGSIKKNISSPDFYLDELSILYTAIKDCFEWVQQNKDSGGYDMLKIDQLIKITGEGSRLLSKMAEFQGRLKGPGDAQTKILQVEGNLNIITDILSGGILCPKCEKVVMEKLKNIIN